MEYVKIEYVKTINVDFFFLLTFRTFYVRIAKKNSKGQWETLLKYVVVNMKNLNS